MNRPPGTRISLFAQLAFASVVVAVFTQLTFNDALRGPEWRVPATFALGAAHAVLFSLCHHRLAGRGGAALPLYYGVQVLLVGTMVWISPARGFFAIIGLPLLSQAIFDFKWRGALLVGAAVFVPTVAVWSSPYGAAGVARAAVTYLPAFMFAVTFTLISQKAIEARARSDQLADELAEANAQLRAQAVETAELATTRERNRVAREIHDGVGHYLTTIKVQLDAAAALLPADPARAADSVAKASRLAGEALEDVRRSVSALATDRPRPPLLDSLRQLAADATPPAHLAVEGEPAPLSTATEHALHRAAQEGLTNIRKHARATASTLTLDFRGAASVLLRVTDDGRAGSVASPAGSGYGLRGLRERIDLLGGSVRAGPRPAGGFELAVELPR